MRCSKMRCLTGSKDLAARRELTICIVALGTFKLDADSITLLARSFAGPWMREMIFPSVNSVDGSIWKSGVRLACLVSGGGARTCTQLLLPSVWRGIKSSLLICT